ncbi:MAG TPA: hypothetical protein VH081_06230 [Solirubrobacteraceae bacterium]|jgi:hypothetical protein|nr:hypothetical protein [Solirubrobacteraceae bacterium]
MSRAAGHFGLYRAIASAVPASAAPPATGRRGGLRARRRSRAAASAAAAPRLLPLRVYLARGSLDRQIARGVSLAQTPALALRARQLGGAPERRSLASDLRRAVDYADRVESRTRLSAVMLEPARIRAGRGAILRLAERLEQAAAVSPQGVALARVLLTDAASPMFDRGSDRTVTDASCIADDALVSGELAPLASR